MVKTLFIIFFLTSIMFSVFSEETITVEKYGYKIVLDKNRLRYYEDSKNLCNGILAESAIIYGIYYDKETGFFFSQNGYISEVFLKKEAVVTVGKNKFIADGTINLRGENIISARLAQDSFLFVNDEKVFFKAGHILLFDSSCNLKVTTINILNQNVAFLISEEPHNKIQYYDSGKFKYGQLPLGERSILNVNGQEIPFIMNIRCYESGSVESGSISKTIYKIKGQNISLFEYIMLYESGNIRYSYLTEDTVFDLGGKKIVCYGEVSFYESGNLMYVSLKEEVVFDVGQHKLIFTRRSLKAEPVTFYESGKVKSGYLAKDINGTLKKYDFVFPGRLLTFTEDGELDILATTKTNLGHK